MVKLGEFHFTQAPSYLVLKVTVVDYQVDAIENYSFVSIDQTSHLSLKIDANTHINESEPVELTLNHIIDKTLVLSTVESNNYKYTMVVQETTPLENNGIQIKLKLEKQYTSHCEDINKVDPFLMFYRKLLPYSRYEIFGSYKDEVYELGNIEKITYDTDLKQYKLYSAKGVVLYYDTLPLLNPSKVDIAGTQYTNPPTLIWLLDTQDLTDLTFVDTVKPTKIDITDSRYTSFSDWANDYANDQFNIHEISIEARSVNKRIVIDLDTYSTLDPKEFIPYINLDIVKVFKIPFKYVYFKINDHFTLTRIIIKYDDDNKIQIDGNFVYYTAKG